VNLLPGFQPEDSIQAVIPVRSFDEGSLLFCTAKGTVKRTPLSDYRRPKAGGIIAIGLDEGDRVIDVAVVSDDQEIILGTREGKSIRFPVTAMRSMGRPARGVRGVRLLGDDEVCGMAVVSDDTTLLTVSEHGYGKRTGFDEYPLRGRGGQGVINMRTTKRNGKVIAIRPVAEEDDVIYITEGGQVVRTPVADISSIGRATQGVRLITLKDGDKVASVARIEPDEADDDIDIDGEPGADSPVTPVAEGASDEPEEVDGQEPDSDPDTEDPDTDEES